MIGGPLPTSPSHLRCERCHGPVRVPLCCRPLRDAGHLRSRAGAKGARGEIWHLAPSQQARRSATAGRAAVRTLRLCACKFTNVLCSRQRPASGLVALQLALVACCQPHQRPTWA